MPNSNGYLKSELAQLLQKLNFKQLKSRLKKDTIDVLLNHIIENSYYKNSL